MTLEGIAEIAAGLLALWAAYLSIPSQPALDWRRLFKVSLSTVLRGEVESQDGDADAWAALLALWVPYHPAARDPAGKLSSPDLNTISTPALEGERALVAALAALPDAQARWTSMFVDNERTRDALMTDPDGMGEDYDPARAFGAGATWSHIAAWPDEMAERLQRRFSHAVVVSIGGTFAEELGATSGLRAHPLAVDPSPDESALHEALFARLPAASDRLILILEAEGAAQALRVMRAHEGLRDRVIAVLSLGATLQGSDAQKAWMKENFTQDHMDTELNRSTPYLSVQVVDPRQPLSVDWSAQQWPAPAESRNHRLPIVRDELGPLPVDWLGEPERRVQLARAVWTLLAFRIQD